MLLALLLLEVPGSDIKDNISSVYKNVENCCHNESCHNIEGRMLLDKHGGKDNTYRNSKAGILDPLLSAKPLTVHHCKINTYRIIHMDAWPQIGWCIHPVYHTDHVAEYIVSRHYSRSQIVNIRPQCRDKQEYRHSRKEKSAYSVVIISVCKTGIEHDPCHIEKPDDIGNDKNLNKWNFIIQRSMNNRVS